LAQKLGLSAPTALRQRFVGGSKKHGGPDLGPTRAKLNGGTLGVDGMGIANEAPSATFPFDGLPRLTIPMVARLQGFQMFGNSLGKNGRLPTDRQRLSSACGQGGLGCPSLLPSSAAATWGTSVATAIIGKITRPINPHVKKGIRKALILEFLLENLGRVVTSKELQNVSGGASEWPAA